MIKEIWNKWKEIAEKIGSFQARVIFSILYYVFVFPISLIANISNDFLSVRQFPRWKKIKDNSSTLTKIKEQ